MNNIKSGYSSYRNNSVVSGSVSNGAKISSTANVANNNVSAASSSKNVSDNIGAVSSSKNINDKIGAASSSKNVNDNVVLTLSEDGKEAASTGNVKDNQNTQQSMFERYEQMLKEQSESSKKAAKSAKDTAKILEIARRIASGAKVPKTDEQKLMEYNFQLYLSAKETAMLNQEKEKKEYDKLFKDEDKKNGVVQVVTENGELKIDASGLSDQEINIITK